MTIWFYVLNGLSFFLISLFIHFSIQHSKNGVFDEKNTSLPFVVKTQRALFLEILGTIITLICLVIGADFGIPHDNLLNTLLFQINILFTIVIAIVTVALAPVTWRYLHDQVFS